ncbi:transporter substrate-binding domain-containing protein, partial [Candidatus Frankia nodulisporulans]|uniref:transporter substrate-binding domain-containing protein n=1 Tax=Candidatus Frankia nodulisporulans TaxID=2060052 RepID=UPI0015824E4A
MIARYDRHTNYRSLFGLLVLLALIAAAMPATSARAATRPVTPRALATGAAGSTITVGIKPLDPFVSRNESGVYSGFSIDLWNDIARRNEWQPKYTWFPDIKTVVEAARDNTVDAAISGISITADREEEVDFSYPMFDAGLQILTGDTPVGLDLSHQLRNLVSPSTGRYLAALLLMLLLAGAITSAVTR